MNIYEPDLDGEAADRKWFEDTRETWVGLFRRLDDFMHRILRKPYRADEVFGSAIAQAVLYDNLLQKVGGDKPVVERLLAYERQRQPEGTRFDWPQNAIQRRERDNGSSGSKKT